MEKEKFYWEYEAIKEKIESVEAELGFYKEQLSDLYRDNTATIKIDSGIGRKLSQDINYNTELKNNCNILEVYWEGNFYCRGITHLLIWREQANKENPIFDYIRKLDESVEFKLSNSDWFK